MRIGFAAAPFHMKRAEPLRSCDQAQNQQDPEPEIRGVRVREESITVRFQCGFDPATNQLYEKAAEQLVGVHSPLRHNRHIWRK